ncbi:MAG: hypothetical protein BVN35_19225 [Proteobacteria bacterium ST_bin11]|nr:MAG: hypothetical protein BVN35_19225 [Proteobacteria bacterium ST_bin11]
MRAILCYGELTIKMLLSDLINRGSRLNAGIQGHGKPASTYPCGLDLSKDRLDDGFYPMTEASLYPNAKQPAEDKAAYALWPDSQNASRLSISAKHELSNY